MTAAVIGSNSRAFGMQPDPPKAERIIDEVRVRQIHLFLTILSKLSDMPKKTILARRKSGAKGRSLRRLAIHFAHFLQSPQWEQRIIFHLDRKQLGQEEVAIAKKLEADPGAAWAVGRLFDAMSLLVSINVTDLFALTTNSRPQTARSVDEEMAAEIPEDEAPEPKPTRRAPYNPAKDVSPEKLRRKQEAEALVAKAQLTRQLEATVGEIRIAKAVIQTGGAQGAGKEARDDAKRATRELDALMKKERSLRLALGEIKPSKEECT